MNPKNLTSFSDISLIFSVLYKLPPAVLCKTPTSRRPDYLHFHKHRQPRTAPRPAPHLAPLPKGAGLRQGSIVSNISIFSDTHNAPILQTISAARLRDRRPDCVHSVEHRQPRTAPRPALPHTRLMNALFVLRPAKLWAFNIGHPCPSLAKGELLLLKSCSANY